MTDTSFSIESLLDHQEWITMLARRLVPDPGRADDVAQQTLLETMQRPPADWSNPRGWLATAARNVARNLARADLRRSRRERVAARSEQSADAATLVERARLHRMLVDAVLALDELYRDVLLMRFFDELPPREIAQRLGRPVETVRTQIARGLERIRRSLDAEHGDRREWCLALAPLIPRGELVAGSSLLILGGSVVLIKWAAAVAAVAILMWSLGYAWDESESVPPQVGGGGMASNSVDPEIPAMRKPLQTQVDSESGDHSAATKSSLYVARIVDILGQPMVGLEIETTRLGPWVDAGGRVHVDGAIIDPNDSRSKALLDGEHAIEILGRYFANPSKVLRTLRGERLEPEFVTTDSEGRFQFEDSSSYRAARWSGDMLPVASSVGRRSIFRALQLPGNLMIYGEARAPGKENERILIAGPSVSVSGRVVDSHDVGIAKVQVRVWCKVTDLPGYPQTLIGDVGGNTYYDSETDEHGAYDLGRVPGNPFLKVTAAHVDYLGADLRVPVVDRSGLRLVMKRRPDDQPSWCLALCSCPRVVPPQMRMSTSVRTVLLPMPGANSASSSLPWTGTGLRMGISSQFCPGARWRS